MTSLQQFLSGHATTYTDLTGRVVTARRVCRSGVYFTRIATPTGRVLMQPLMAEHEAENFYEQMNYTPKP